MELLYCYGVYGIMKTITYNIPVMLINREKMIFGVKFENAEYMYSVIIIIVAEERR